MCLRFFAKLVLQAVWAQAKEACRSVNLCAGLEAGIEGTIHAVREQEDLGREETRTERRERLESEEQTRLREDPERKRERRQQVRSLATIPEGTEGEEEDEALETK